MISESFLSPLGNPVYNICHPQFGAVPEEPDSTAKIQKALSVGGGAAVYVPPGIFNCQQLEVESQYTRLLGAGKGLSRLRAITAGAKVIDIGAPDVQIDNLWVDGNGMAGYGIYLEDNSFECGAADVRVEGCTGSPGIGIANADRAYSSRFAGVIVTGNRLGAQLIKRCQFTVIDGRSQFYNNAGGQVAVGDGTGMVYAISIRDTQLENDSYSGVANLALNWAQVLFEGYCESDGSAASADIVINGSNPSVLRAAYYSNGNSVADYSVVINTKSYLTLLAPTYTHNFLTGTVHDVTGASVIDWIGPSYNNGAWTS